MTAYDPIQGFVDTFGWHDFSPDAQVSLAWLQDEPVLARLVHAQKIKACDYMLFLMVNVIECEETRVTLTSKGKGWLDRYVNIEKIPAGDVMHVHQIKPKKTMYKTFRWVCVTDDPAMKEYEVSLYEADLKAIAKAGHKMPIWEDNGAVDVDFDIYVSREQIRDKWRMAGIFTEPAQISA